MFLQVEVPAEAFAALFACVWLRVIMRVHVECEIVHLMECFVADVTFVGLFPCVCQSMIFIVSLLMETFSAELANPRLEANVNANVSGQSGTSVEGFSARLTFMRLFGCVNNFMATERRGLAETFATNLTNKRPGSRVNGHMSS